MTEAEKAMALQFIGGLYGESLANDQMIVETTNDLNHKSNTIKSIFSNVMQVQPTTDAPNYSWVQPVEGEPVVDMPVESNALAVPPPIDREIVAAKASAVEEAVQENALQIKELSNTVANLVNFLTAEKSADKDKSD